MKERPILFSGPMVRAILEGRKTVTRRLVKPQPPATHSFKGYVIESSRRKDEGKFSWGIKESEYHFRDTMYAGCPYGQPGDRLWVRESTEEDCIGIASISRYCADGAPVLYEGCDDPEFNGSWAHWDYPRSKRPSIHMPRWASRITLEIVSVRVERLQEVSEEDAKAEGAFFTDYGRRCFHQGAPRDVGQCPAPDDHHPQREGWSMVPTESHEQCLSSASTAFANLWECINGPGSWAANPWVWVVEFKRVQQERTS